MFSGFSFLSKYRSHLLLHLTVFIFGFTGIIGKLISLPAHQLVWYRMLIAMLSILFYIMAFQRQNLHCTFKQGLRYVLTGGIIAAHWIFFYLSVKKAPVSIGVVCLSSSTFFTALFEPLFFKRKLKVYELLLGLLIILGLYMIFKINDTYRIGMFYGIISAILAALFPVLNGLFIKTGNAYTLTFVELAGGLLLLTLFFLFTGEFNSHFFDLNAMDLIWLLVLGIICTAFTFVISVEIMKTISPYTVVMSVNLEPLYTIVLAAVIFNEYAYLEPRFYVGALFILVIIFTNALMKRKYPG